MSILPVELTVPWTGPAGPAGPPGPPGPQGMPGPAGPAGAQGPLGPAGAQGPEGDQGIPGIPGKDGNTILYGVVDPVATNGKDGDFWINTTTHFIFGPKAASVWPAGTSLIGPQGPQGIQGVQGPQGIQGVQGVSGNTVLYGTSDPTIGVGVNGDFYINTTTHFMFGPKSVSWPAGTSLIGPPGPQGIQGVPGPAGGSTVYVGDTPPTGVADNSLWWETDSGMMFLKYNDGDTTQWVVVSVVPGASPDLTGYLQKSGGTMTGPLIGVSAQMGSVDLIPSITNKVVASSTTAQSFVAVGQDTAHHLELGWNYNAAPASAGAAIATWGYNNPIAIDGSSVSLNSNSAGPVTAPTPAAGDNSTKVATTAFVNSAIHAMTPLASLTDFNTVQTTGLYFTNYADCTNTPASPGGAYWYLEVLGPSPTAYVLQRATLYTAGAAQTQTWERRLVASSWTAWDLMLTTGALTLTAPQLIQARQNIYAAPFDALAYNGMQINGSMEVSQELGTTGRSNTGFVCDGWQWVNNNAASAINVNTGLTTFAPGYKNFLSAVVGTVVSPLATDVVCFQQNIEGYRVSRLAWGTASAQPITIAFWTWHTKPGLYSGSVRSNTGARSYVFTYTQNANAVEYKTVTIPGDVTGTWLTDNGIGMLITFTMECGANFTAPSANTWFAGNYIAAPGQVNGADAVNNAFRVTGVVVVPGNEAPPAARAPFIMRPYDQELLTCQRYLEYGTGRPLAFSGNIQNGSAYIATVPFRVLKRAAPTMTFSGFNAGSFNALPFAQVNATIHNVEVECLANATLGYSFFFCSYMADARL